MAFNFFLANCCLFMVALICWVCLIVTDEWIAWQVNKILEFRYNFTIKKLHFIFYAAVCLSFVPMNLSVYEAAKNFVPKYSIITGTVLGVVDGKIVIKTDNIFNYNDNSPVDNKGIFKCKILPKIKEKALTSLLSGNQVAVEYYLDFGLNCIVDNVEETGRQRKDDASDDKRQFFYKYNF